MEQKILGLVLKSMDYRDNDKLVNIFTNEGIKTCLLKGCKKPNAKLRFASEPFCLGEYILVTKGNRTTVTNCTLVDLFYDIRLDMKKTYAAYTILEFLLVAMQSQEDTSILFDLAVDCIKNICYKEKVEKVTLIYFLVKALEIEGYGLNLDTCSVCSKKLTGKLTLNFDEGAFCHQSCSNNGVIDIEESLVDKLKAISDSKEIRDPNFTIKGEEIKKILKILSKYFTYHYDKNLNSIKML